MRKLFLDVDIEKVAGLLGDDCHSFAGKVVLITGARGFLGRYFMEFFSYLNKNVLSVPVSVLALDNFISSGAAGRNFGDHPNIRFIEHDVVDPFDTDMPVNYIFHAAGIASPFYYRAEPLRTLDVAVGGTRNLLQLAKEKGAKFLFFSSSEIYGDPDPRHVPIPESYRGNVSTLGPRACYDESKRLGETLCYIYKNYYGVHTNIIRPFNVFGPGMQEQDYRVLPNFASRIKSGQPLKVYGNGSQTRTFCYITDALVGFLLVGLKGVSGEPYNIGCDSPEISMTALVASIENIRGHKLEIDYIEYPDSYPGDEPMRRCPDLTKARLQLGYRPVTSLEEGLQKFLEWTDTNYDGDLS